MEERRIDMCGGIAGPPMGEDRPSRYSRSPMLRDPYEDRKKKTGGMKKECSKCGQINPTNTECWKCGRYN